MENPSDYSVLVAFSKRLTVQVYRSNAIWMVWVDVERAESRRGDIIRFLAVKKNGAFPMARPVDIDVLVMPRNAFVRFHQGRGHYDNVVRE